MADPGATPLLDERSSPPPSPAERSQVTRLPPPAPRAVARPAAAAATPPVRTSAPTTASVTPASAVRSSAPVRGATSTASKAPKTVSKTGDKAKAPGDKQPSKVKAKASKRPPGDKPAEKRSQSAPATASMVSVTVSLPLMDIAPALPAVSGMGPTDFVLPLEAQLEQVTPGQDPLAVQSGADQGAGQDFPSLFPGPPPARECVDHRMARQVAEESARELYQQGLAVPPAPASAPRVYRHPVWTPPMWSQPPGPRMPRPQQHWSPQSTQTFSSGEQWSGSPWSYGQFGSHTTYQQHWAPAPTQQIDWIGMSQPPPPPNFADPSDTSGVPQVTVATSDAGQELIFLPADTQVLIPTTETVVSVPAAAPQVTLPETISTAPAGEGLPTVVAVVPADSDVATTTSVSAAPAQPEGPAPSTTPVVPDTPSVPATTPLTTPQEATQPTLVATSVPGSAPAVATATASAGAPAIDPQLLAAAALLAQQGMPRKPRSKRRRHSSSDSESSDGDSPSRRRRRGRRSHSDTKSLFLQMEQRLDQNFQRRLQEQEQKHKEQMEHQRELMTLRFQALSRSRSPSEHSRSSRDPTPTSPRDRPWRATAAPRYGEAFRNAASPPTLTREDMYTDTGYYHDELLDTIVIKDEPSSDSDYEVDPDIDISPTATSAPTAPPATATAPSSSLFEPPASTSSEGPANASAIAEAAAKIDQPMCRTHVRQACQLLKTEHGKLTDHSYESNFATGLPSATFYRDHGMVSSPEERVAWPHVEALDLTQQDNTASLQRQQGTSPAEDLFSIPPPPKSGDKFLPLPAKKIKRDLWYYMSQSASKSSWSLRAPQGTIMDPGYTAPPNYSVPHSQFIAQESNLRHMSHLAAMTNMASVALGTIIFDLFKRNLLPAFPIVVPGMEEPLTFEWFLSMLQLMGSSTSQLAHNAVSAAMNLQTIRREAFIAGGRTGVSPDDRERLKVAPMDSEDLFGRQASNIAPRRELWQREGPASRSDRNAAIIVREVTRSAADQASRPQQSQGSSKKKKGSKKKSGGQSASQGRPPQAPPQQSFRSNAGRGQQPAAGRGRGTPAKRNGPAGRGGPRPGSQ